MSAWQTVPGIAAMVACLTAGGLLREFAANVYYGKPKRYNLDPFTRLLLHRDAEIMEERDEAK
jgi:hypothetical protein